MRIIGASVPSQVSVKKRQSMLLSKIRSLIIKDLFDNDLIFRRAMLRVVGTFRCEITDLGSGPGVVGNG